MKNKTDSNTTAFLIILGFSEKYSLSPSEPPVSLCCSRASVLHTGGTPARPHRCGQLYSVQWLLDSGPKNTNISHKICQQSSSVYFLVNISYTRMDYC